MNKKLTPIEEKTQADYDLLAKPFSASRKGMRWPELTEFLEKIPSEARLLDIGCGTGRVCRELEGTGIQYTGVDISQQMLEQAQHICPDEKFVRASMLELPFENGSFDVVLMVASLHHLLTEEERQKALHEALRVLRAEGQLFLTVMSLWSPKNWRLFFDKKQGRVTLPPEQQRQLRWNDVFKPWAWGTNGVVYRYYHAFTKKELQRLAASHPCSIMRLRYMKKGHEVSALRANNLVLEARKRV